MLPGGSKVVRKISVSDQAYTLLNKLREELGTTTHSETILLLAERARLCNKLEQELAELRKQLQELEAATRKLYLAVTRLLEEGRGE